MGRVVALGGVFFKADDRDAVLGWYRRVLDFPVEEWGGAMFPWPTQGKGVWMPFRGETEYFAPSTAPFMINFVVEDLDGVLAKAAAEGVEPLGRQDDDANGKFAWLLDPAGVKIELWEPAEEAGG